MAVRVSTGPGKGENTNFFQGKQLPKIINGEKLSFFSKVHVCAKDADSFPFF